MPNTVETMVKTDAPILDTTSDTETEEVMYHDIFRTVLEDLIRVTHCHGCGQKRNVCFFGYVGEYCAKRCYKGYQLYENFYDTNSEDYDAEDDKRLPHRAIPCGWCEANYPLSHANSNYHSSFYSSWNKAGFYWPMLAYNIPCHNTCIRECPIIRIPGYNDGY